MMIIKSVLISNSIFKSIQSVVKEFSQSKSIAYSFNLYYLDEEGFEIKLNKKKINNWSDISVLSSKNQISPKFVQLAFEVDEEEDDLYLEKNDTIETFLMDLGLYNSSKGIDETVSCLSCNWKGSVKDLLEIEDDFGFEITDLCCPVCNENRISVVSSLKIKL